MSGKGYENLKIKIFNNPLIRQWTLTHSNKSHQFSTMFRKKTLCLKKPTPSCRSAKNDRRAKPTGLGYGRAVGLWHTTQEGHPVRISGQDVERGTFSHRHAEAKSESSEEEIYD